MIATKIEAPFRSRFQRIGRACMVLLLLVNGTLIALAQSAEAPDGELPENADTAQQVEEVADVSETVPPRASDAEPERAPVSAAESEPSTPDFDQMTARDYFALLEFGESYWEMLLDGQPLAVEEQEAIVRVLTRIRRLQPHRTTQWLRLETPWKELAEQPAAHRLEIFLLTGEITAIRTRKIPPEAAERAGLEVYYEVDVRVHRQEGPAPGTIVVEQIPAVWKKTLDEGGSVEGEPFSCPGIYLKAFPAEEGQSGYVFATPKISWHPSQPNAALGLTEAHVQLAEQGMDVAELSQVEDRVRFSGKEREPFYQMMAAVRRIPPSQQKPTIEASVSQLLTQQENGLMVTPEKYRAQFLRLQGLCRRITRIEVEDEDIRQRLGISHYFEVSIFVPIESPIVSQRQGDEATRKEFSNDYPVLVCVPELPPGLKAGEDLHQEVAATGAFFKLWAYRTPFMSREDFTRRQISPLLIASTVEVAAPLGAPQLNEFALALGVVLVGVIGVGVAFGVLFARRSHKRRR